MRQKHHVPAPVAVVVLISLVCYAPVSCGGQGETPIKEDKPASKVAAEPASKPAVKKKVLPPLRPDTQGSRTSPALHLVVFQRDRNMVLARVKGQDIKLEDIVQHIDERSYKGYLTLAEGGHLDATLSSPTLATWTREFADIRALELMALEQKIAPGRVDKERKELANNRFFEYLESYKLTYRRDHGKEYPENARSVASLNRQFLLRRGLNLEREAWLNTLAPDALTQEEADWYLQTNPQIFNGYLDIAVITIHNRDPKTGALYKGPAKAKVTAKVLDIQSRLKKDGSNFEKVAAKFSDVAKERARAGIFSNISRFDPQLPAAICRTAWGLRNSKFKGPVESPFGLHFVKRITYHSKSMVVRLDPKNKDVRRYVRQLRQEDLIFKARREQKVELIH
ncbi:MAG: peptidylprolyl isomerase [Planctomycetota bacterium]|jgi:hypothetical protein